MTVIEDKVDIVSSEEVGYKGIWSFESWKIAMTKDSLLTHLENIEYLSKHLETDEAFILLEGEAGLFVGHGDETIGRISYMELQRNKVLVLHKGTWHIILTRPGCRVVIVENENTTAQNTVKMKVDKTLLSSALS